MDLPEIKLPGFKIMTATVSREKAIELYLSDGGIIKYDGYKIIYPDKQRLASQLDEVNKKYAYLNSIISELQRHVKSYEYDSTMKTAARVVDPVFWEHLYKMRTDDDYRVAFDKVQPPIERMRDERWKSVVRMFVQDKEYRDRLVEAKTSVISSNHSMKDELEKNLESSKSLVKLRLQKLKKERVYFEEKITLLKAMHEYVE
ncbi:hypothetical protein H0N95_01740 [Candidatus Micrarchaeota archaeon]|nr:hypothetical protein [Candidatus Micrarchaeota archaeon]